MVGELVAGRYRIEHKLGAGGMGVVYAVRDERLEERVALKVLTSNAGNEQASLRFQREVRLARRVTSPHVARTHDIGTHAGMHFLTMELIEGESVRERLARGGALPLEEGLRVGEGVARGLAAAHAASVLHRDLKPANVMIDREGRAVITDFGVARPTEELGDGVVTVGFVGTLRYLAPEVLEGAPFDERSDLYALGVVLWELFRGVPYRLSQLRDDEPTRADTADALPRGTPPALERLIRSLLSLVPERRPATATEVATSLAVMRAELVANAEDAEERAVDTSPLLAGASSSARAPSTSIAGGALPRAPLPRGQRLLVAPFKGRGGDEAGELAEVLSEELVDVLSRNKAMQVLAHRTAPEGAGEAVAREAASAGAEWVVSGAVLRRGSHVRVSVRLVEVASGAQLYSERFDAVVTDLFELQDRIAARIGEALRVKISVVSRRGELDERAVECYLRGRGKLLAQRTVSDSGVEDFEEAIQRAPQFSGAVAAHAIAIVRRWWVYGAAPEGEQFPLAVESSVKRAETLAPDIAETHLAAGLWAAHRGEYRAAVEALYRAIDIAPTCALAHDHLGQLECEAGRGESGVERIELAHTLDPLVVAGQVWVARWYALGGRVEEALARIAAFDEHQGVSTIARLHLRIRIAAWHGEHATLRRCRALVPGDQASQLTVLRDYASVILDEHPLEELLADADRAARASTNARLATFLMQLVAEAASLMGAAEHAATRVALAADRALADIDWLERCPALAAVRELSQYPSLHRAVYATARTVWAG